MGAYDADLAFAHDAGFTALAVQAATLAVELLAGGPEGPVLDLGCGGGVTARELADAGRKVRGIDISPDQVELARKRVPEGQFAVGSLHDADLGSGLAAILAVGEIVNYSFDERASTAAAGEFFARAHDALAPGGLLLFDSAGPGRVPGDGGRTFAEGAGWAVLFSASESSEPPEVVREITTFRREPGAAGSWRRSHETHTLRLHDPAELERLLAGSGFDPVERRNGYDGTRFAPALDVFVARRPRSAYDGG